MKLEQMKSLFNLEMTNFNLLAINIREFQMLFQISGSKNTIQRTVSLRKPQPTRQKPMCLLWDTA